jgi:CBS domain containing-hemolysin-like protein
MSALLRLLDDHSSMTPWYLLGLALLLLVGNAVFVASETALVTVERSEVNAAAARGDRRAGLVQGALKRLSTHLSGAQLGITVTSLAIGLLSEPSIATLLHGPLEGAGLPEDWVEGVGVAIALVLASVVQMILGELVPKNLALSRPLATAYAVVVVQLAFSALTRPVVVVLNGIADKLLRAVGVEPTEELRSARTPDELAMLLSQSAAQGALSFGAAELLTNSLSFGDRCAADAMTPRVQVDFAPDNGTVASLIALARRTGHSRFPATGEDEDEVTGLVHVKHALAVPREERRSVRVRDIMVAPVLVPSTVPLHVLLDALRSRGLQMAVVVDEFGGTDGVVTLEDVVEELVGEVRDETDLVGTQRARHRKDGSWLLSGRLRPDEVLSLTGIALPEGSYETIAGLLQAELGRVGAHGEVVELPHARLRIERMDGRRIDRVVLVPLEDA